MDSLARNTLSVRKNNYKDYSQEIKKYELNNKKALIFCESYTEPLTSIIHEKFPDLINLDKIKYNRIVDKFLWTIGKDYKTRLQP